MSLRQHLVNTLLFPEPFNPQWLPEDPHRADFICPAAFGRNTWSDTAVGAIIHTAREELCHGDDIATFEWLKSKKFNPGLPNALLADTCFASAHDSEKPIIGQWEVLYEIYHRWPKWYQDHKDRLFAVWPPKEGPLRTRDLFLETKKIADGHRRKTPLLIAHYEHIQRCYFLGRNIFNANPAASVGTKQEGWFDPKSVQWQTRGALPWFFYEMAVRFHHNLYGWM